MTTPPNHPKEVPPAFFTVGYAGRSIDALIEALSAAGVAILLDVRHFPGSRFRPEVSKNNVKTALNSAGIEYAHERELGIPAQVRRAHGFPEHSDSLWDWYDEHVIGARLNDLSWFRSLDDGPVAMMCVEQDAQDCHRHRLAAALEARGIPYGGEI